MNLTLKSVSSLKPRLDSYFAQRGIRRWGVVSMAAPLDLPETSEAAHLVLLGDSPFYLSFFTHWPWRGECYLWTLSTALRNLLVKVGGIPEKYIGVISRYDLYPPRSPSYSLNEIDSFIYAGRDVPGKNLSLLCNFANRNGLELHICGPGQRKDFGESWPRHFSGKPAFISLSHYRFEDFSVALAEAQSAGMPVICPAWYGFKDVVGSATTVLKLRPFPELLGEDYSENMLITHWSRQLASLSTWSSEGSPRVSSAPAMLSSNLLSSLINLREHRLSLALYEYFTPAFNPRNLDSYKDVISNML